MPLPLSHTYIKKVTLNPIWKQKNRFKGSDNQNYMQYCANTLSIGILFFLIWAIGMTCSLDAHAYIDALSVLLWLNVSP